MTALKLYQRIYWIILFVVFSIILAKLISQLWRAFQTKPISFTVDTNYLNWNTTFPAISICEIYNTEKMWDMNEKVFGPDRNKYYDDIMTDVTFFSGLCYSCKKCESNREFCSGLSLYNITKSFRTECNNLIGNCKWNGEPFECCEGFRMLQSEFGACYTINSLHTSPKFGKALISNRETGPGKLELVTKEDVEIYLHSTEDIPSKSTDRSLHETVLWGVEKEILFGVQEIINEVEVEDTTVTQRRCRFHWEAESKEGYLFEAYSYSTCMVQCNLRIQLDICGCVHHLMPKGVRMKRVHVCDFYGLICLTDNYDLINSRKGSECKCMISCTEQDINIIYSSNDITFHEMGTKLTIGMMDLPKMRYIRKTVRTPLDFIISLGGLAGLLFGVSIIKFVEFFYRIFRRIFG